MITWTATDTHGVKHTYTACRLTVLEALRLFAAYCAYKSAMMTMGNVTPDPAWMPAILWGVPGRVATRDGQPLSDGTATLTYQDNLAEMFEAAEERAKAEGFFASWMQRLTSKRLRPDSPPDGGTEKPNGS